VPGTMLDHLDREVEPSLSALPWPHQASVKPLYSVMAVTARVKSATIHTWKRITRCDRLCIPSMQMVCVDDVRPDVSWREPMSPSSGADGPVMAESVSLDPAVDHPGASPTG